MAQRYGDSHKLLIQAMMSIPVSTEENMLLLHKLITGSNSDSTVGNLTSMVKEVNSEIKKFHMEIKKQICEVSETTYYTLISVLQTEDEAFEKLIQIYSPSERDYFRLLVEEIVTSEERCITQTSALNLSVPTSSQASQHLGPGVNSKFLERFVADQWLVVTEEGKIYLAARAIAELEHLLLNTYDVESCVCGRVCVSGFRCERESCCAVMHSHCQRKVGGRKAIGSVCTKCGSEMRRL